MSVELTSFYCINILHYCESLLVTECGDLSYCRNTMQAVRVDQVRLTRLQARLHHLSDFKRRRKLPPGAGSAAPNMSSSHPPIGKFCLHMHKFKGSFKNDQHSSLQTASSTIIIIIIIHVLTSHTPIS